MYIKNNLVRCSTLFLVFLILSQFEQPYLALNHKKIRKKSTQDDKKPENLLKKVNSYNNPVFGEIVSLYSSNRFGPPVFQYSAKWNIEPFSGFHSSTRFFTEFAFYENSDYRTYIGNTSAQIQRTDDLQYFAASLLRFDLYAKPNKSTFFRTSFSNILFFGATNQTLPDRNVLIMLEEISVEYQPSKTFAILLGRFYYKIQEDGSNYVFSDFCNGVSLLLYPLPKLRLRLLLFDILSSETAYGQSPAYLLPVPSSTLMGNFKGDTKAIRMGGVFDSTSINSNYKVPWLFSVYGFFIKYGAVIGGTERSGLGAFGNQSDGDYLFFFGTRQKVLLGKLSLILEGAGSTGLDRKIYGFAGFTNEVYANGYLLMLDVGSPLFFKAVPRSIWGLTFLYASGAEIDRYGNKRSYGFTSGVAEPIGGILTGRFKGYHAGTIAGREGFHHNPYEPDRASGVFYVKQNFEMEWKNILLKVSNHYFIDVTNSFYSVEPTIDYNVPIGLESNVLISVALNKNLFITLAGGIFFPEEFLQYKKYTHLPAGHAPFYGLLFGVYLVF
ncbi:MAG: hypothetical protein ABUK01_06240 [Leptospirales bacterium]